MPLIGYRKEFADLVESGEKRQTIRAKRKRPFKIGDKLYHYSGLRTKNCRKILESECKYVEDIIITGFGNVYINERQINVFQLAYDDGFREFPVTNFFNFFKKVHGIPFEGQVIRW